MSTFNYLSLFSGACGGDLGFQHLLEYNCVGYVEWENYCVKIIEQRIKDGFLSDAPIFHCDIREFNKKYAKAYQGISCITAGFPCQPFSVAGKQKGEQDERNMWPETWNAIRIIRPRYVFLENVPGLLNHEYIWQIYGDLASGGYDCRWSIISAKDVGAPHLRKRWWCLATHTNSKGNTGERPPKSNNQWIFIGRTFTPASWGDVSEWEKWLYQPELLRVPYGFPYIMDRLKAIGNGQVPEVVRTAWEVLSGEAS